MKIPSYRLGQLFGIVGISSLLLAPTALNAQENEPRAPEAARKPERTAPKDAPADAKRMRRMMRELGQLQAAGKAEEARNQAGKIREMAKGNPQMMERIERAVAGSAPKRFSDQKNIRPQKDGPPPQAKMQLLRQAAEQLQAAGYKEQADKARAEIGRLEGEMRRQQDEAKRPEQEKSGDARRGDGGPVMDELRKLRREVNELRAEVRRMKAERAQQPPRPPMRPMEGVQ